MDTGEAPKTAKAKPIVHQRSPFKRTRVEGKRLMAKMGAIAYYDMINAESAEARKRVYDQAAAYLASLTDSSEEYEFTSPRAIALHKITQVLGPMPYIDSCLTRSLSVPYHL
jgi:hypothetical protein